MSQGEMTFWGLMLVFTFIVTLGMAYEMSKDNWR